MAVPKSDPTPYVTAIARALQKVTRMTPGTTLAPPVFAASPPRIARAIKATTATATASEAEGINATTVSGSAAPAA